MEKKDAAFPVFCGNEHSPAEGMSKRFYAACAIMQGLVSNEILWTKFLFEESNDMDVWYAKRAYELADELLKQE